MVSISLQQVLLLLLALGQVSATPVDSGNSRTRNMYTIRPPGTPRKTVEIIDLGTFLLTNSDDGRPKSMVPFYLNVFETREELSDDALRNVEEATSNFLLAELNAVFPALAVFSKDPVANVKTQIVSQERFVEEMEVRKMMLLPNNKEESNSNQNGVRGRMLRAVPGSKFKVNVNVTFDREPSPDAAVVDDSLQLVMQDLTYLVDNMTATEDPELGYVFKAYREEISTVNQDPVTAEAQKPIPDNTGEQSIKFIIPVLVALVLFAAIVAGFVIRRRRRRVQAANQKVQEDLAFLDEETNVFSFENSPTKSSARKRALDMSDPNNYDGDESSRYSASQGSLEQTSLSYGMISAIGGSPTARSSLSGASTVKVSNARLMPLPSKLTQLASTSLFAFSEEDEDYEMSTDGGHSQRTPMSNGSSFNRIMSGKSEEEGSSTIASSPRHGVTSPSSAAMAENSVAADQYGSSKSTIASFFSSHFFSGGDSVSQFAGSTLTERVANTTEAVRRKAATKKVRSFSLSPKKSHSPSPSVKSRAKSETGGDDDDESADSVFDFLAVSPKVRVHKDKNNTKAESPAKSATSSPSKSPGKSPTKSPKQQITYDTDIGPQDPPVNDNSVNRSTTSANDEAASRSASKSTTSPSNANRSANSSLVSEDGRKPAGKVATGPPQTQQAEHFDEDILSEEDSLSDAPGSFPRSRRHAKSTTHDGTFAYQTNAMQPQDWSMTDGMSDDDTLSEQGGGAAFGAFPRSGYRSPKSSQKKPDKEKSPSNQSKSSYSAVTQNSPASKADSSQASASRQLINDLVWLSKKIAGVKQSAAESAPGEVSALGPSPAIEPVDSLSYASQDGLTSPTSQQGATTSSSPTKQRTPLAQTPNSASNQVAATGNAVNTSIVCRDCYAPPGKLNIVIHSTKDGPAVHEVKDGSCLEGRIYPGDLIISVDEIDTRAFTAAQLMKLMAEKSQSERKITVLHFEETEASSSSET